MTIDHYNGVSAVDISIKNFEILHSFLTLDFIKKCIINIATLLFQKIDKNVFKKVLLDQCLELGKASQDDSEPVKGQIIISLLSRDGPCGGTPLAIVGPLGDLRGPSDSDNTSVNGDDLPPEWEERRTQNGRLYYVNHMTRSTQWIKPQVVNKNRSRPRLNNNLNGIDNNLDGNR